ncbi:MAG: peptidoglycan DD-metalloendopeptidase family protein [Candidatus Omnitrophica bacterium]|nr:peptidoglycan DD-metalloendopeptidase family protein [Candidatus Omnitrophota bacterium]
MKNFSYLMIAVLMSTVIGCATIEDPDLVQETPEIRAIPPEVRHPEVSDVGFYHKVRKGETIWRIAKIYQTPIDDIIQANRIPNAAHLEENQLLLIPGEDKTKDQKLSIEDVSEISRKEDFSWPLRGKILRYFGQDSRSPYHQGICIHAHSGEGVRAARAGRVIFADYLLGYAYTVIVDHQDGFCSVYSQNSKILIKLNDTVHQGDRIAEVGQKDQLSFLYFQIRKKGNPDNPLYYLPKL